MWEMLLGKTDSSVQILERMGSRAERSGESRSISEEYFEITLVTCHDHEQSALFSGIEFWSIVLRKYEPFRQLR